MVKAISVAPEFDLETNHSERLASAPLFATTINWGARFEQGKPQPKRPLPYARKPNATIL